MTIETVYRTEDGSVFDTKEAAEKHAYVAVVYDEVLKKFGDGYNNYVSLDGISEFYEFIKFLQDNGVKV